MLTTTQTHLTMSFSQLIPTRLPPCAKTWRARKPFIKAKWAPYLPLAHQIPPQKPISKRLLWSGSEHYSTKWRCPKSAKDHPRALPQGKPTSRSGYSERFILWVRVFDPRWRARLRLLWRLTRKWSLITASKGWLESFQKNWRQIGLLGLMFSLVGFSCLYLRVTAGSASQELPYSDLVTYLSNGRVKSALFEEGSRLIYFNLADNPDDHGGFAAEKSKSLIVEKGNNKLGLAMDYDQHGSFGNSAQIVSSNVATAGNNVQGLGEVQEGGQLLEALAERPEVLQKSPVLRKGAAKTARALMTRSPSKAWQFSTRRIKHDEGFLLGLMRDRGVTYSSAPQSVSASLRTLLITILTLWIPLSPLLFILHRQLSINSNLSQKRKKRMQSVKFHDVAGVDTAKEELMEIVSCLRGTSTFKSLGAKLPKGILLVGPPGTGKTLLARAVASESGVPFFAASASEFVEMFVGRGAARVRELFAGARKCSPSIIFVDEIDAVGGKRGRTFNDERDQTLNQLLTELDGFESETGVIVIAATNRPEALDPALCRPGRFSRKVVVKEPDFNGRCQILAVHMRGIPLEEDAEMIQKSVASCTPGLVGADLANIVNEAAMLAARQGHSSVSLSDFKEATKRVKYGIGEYPNVANVVESEITRWFGWMSSNSRIAEADGGRPAIPTSS